MKKSRKLTLIILASISALFLVAFAVLVIVMPLLSGYPSEVFGEVLAAQFQAIGYNFAMPFMGMDGIWLVLGILTLVITGVWLVTLVLGIVFSCLKKRAIYLVFIPVMVFALFAALVMLLPDYSEIAGIALAGGQTFALMLMSGQAGFIILGIFMFLLGAGGFILTYVTYALGLAWAGRRQYALEPEIAPVAEEASDPEIVEEGEELVVPVIEEPAVASEPVEEPEAEPEPVVEPVPVPEEEVKPEPAEQKSNQVNVNVNNSTPAANGLDQNSLASLLREVVRDIVRDEIARNNANQPEKPQQVPAGNQTITGATFGGPLVVQYFNGGINGVNPPQPVVVEAPKPAPVEEKKPEPEPVKEEPKPEPVKEEPKPEPAPAPVVEVKPEPVPLFTKKPEEPGKPEAPKYERIGFAERLLKSDKELHDLYNELKNEILSYGVKSRISAVGDTFRLHKKMYVRITVAGKSLKLYFALDPKDYEGSTIPVQDASGKEMYAEIPLVFKVKSGLSVRRCKELIQAVMEKDNLEQGEVGKVNWIKELKAEMAADKKKEKEKEE